MGETKRLDVPLNVLHWIYLIMQPLLHEKLEDIFQKLRRQTLNRGGVHDSNEEDDSVDERMKEVENERRVGGDDSLESDRMASPSVISCAQ